MVPGTNMTFAGIPRGNERADLLTYLNSKADNPAPLPKRRRCGAKASRLGLTHALMPREQACCNGGRPATIRAELM